MKHLKLPTLKFYTGKSLIIHSVLVAIGMGLSAFQLIKLNKVKNYNLSLASRSVKVDVVAMPRLSLPELKELAKVKGQIDGDISEPKADPVPKDTTPDTGKEFIKKTETKPKKSLSDLLKQYSDKSVGTSKKKKKKKFKGSNGQQEISAKMRNKLKDLVYAGNKINDGTSFYGDNGGESAGILQEFSERIPDAIRPQWKLPSYLVDKDLRCRIRIYLSANGKLLRSEIIESSGDSEYDSRALKAVKDTRFPAPPETVSKQAARGDIVLGFPL